MSLAYRDVDTTSVPPLLHRYAIERVVLFRALQVGDMLCAVPALRALRGALPQARLTLVGLPWAEQFAHRFSMYIDDFIAFPGHPEFPEQQVDEAMVPAFYETLRALRFDLAVQMHGSGQISNRIVRAFGATATAGYTTAEGAEALNPNFLPYSEAGPEPLRLLRLVEFIGAPPQGMQLEFPLTSEDERELGDSGVADGLVPGSYLCIHPGARIRDKCWPPELFAAVADRLAEEFGLRIVLTGSAKEADLTAAVAAAMRHEAIDTASPISLGAMALLMSRSRLLVCNDTGVSHIAAGLKLPSVVIFSKADIERWAPLDHMQHRCVQDPQGTQVETVLRHARELLAQSSPTKIACA